MIQTIVGKRGRGKTTLCKTLIAESDAIQVYIFDFLGEYHKLNDERLTIARTSVYEFCQNAWNSASPDFKTLVVFDEVDLFGKNNLHIAFLFRYGRHKAIDLISVSRRFYDLPVIIRALTDEFLFFQITEERDLQYLKRLVGQEYIQTLIKLDYFEYVTLAL